jgi:ABC-type molybdate transport system substrate-binding protein
MMSNSSSKFLVAAALIMAVTGSAGAAGIDPPWNPPPEGGKNFTVPGVDNVPDLYGDINDPDLVVFFAGNQYMVVRELVSAFQAAYPAYKRVFVETLPPGILADQIEQGALVVGNLRISLKPDVYAAGRRRMQQLEQDKHWFARMADYARNRLAIMTSLGNPEHIGGWTDLAQTGLAICMPNPKWEGIAANTIIPALHDAGGDALVDKIYREKVADGSAFLTRIHHRETPMRIMEGKCTAGAVWYTEAYFHATLKQHPISLVALPDAQNRVAIYTAGVLKDAPHPQAGEDFLAFLQSAQGQAVYAKYGFLPVH